MKTNPQMLHLRTLKMLLNMLILIIYFPLSGLFKVVQKTITTAKIDIFYPSFILNILYYKMLI